MNSIIRNARSLSRSGILSVLILGASFVQTQAAIQTFLSIGNIEGEATAKGHKNEIEAMSFASGLDRPLSQGGSGASKPQFLEVQIAKKVDKASPLLFVNCATGKRFPTAALTVVKVVNDKPIDFFKITLSEVTITGVNVTGADGKNGELTEVISLSFTRIRWSYVIIDKDGLPGATISGGYDLAKDAQL